jgi:two-component system chemotaxis sensor kinase CheA
MGSKDINAVAGKAELYNFRGDYIPIIRLFDLDKTGSDSNDDHTGVLVVVDVGLGKQRVGLHIDEIMGQQQVVIKSLETNFRQIQGLSGATILGDGTVALILDLSGLVQHYLHGGNNLSTTTSGQQISEPE